MTKPDEFDGSHIIQELRAEIKLLEEMVQHSRAMLQRIDVLLAAKRAWLGQVTAADPGNRVTEETPSALQ